MFNLRFVCVTWRPSHSSQRPRPYPDPSFRYRRSAVPRPPSGCGENEIGCENVAQETGGSEWKGGKDLDAARDVDCEWKHRRHALRNRRRLQPYTHPKPSGLLPQLARIFRGDTNRKNPRERRTPGDEQREAALLDRLGDRPIEGLTRAARRRPSHLRVLNPKRPMDSASRRLHKNSEEEDGKIPAAPRRRGRALPWLDVS